MYVISVIIMLRSDFQKLLVFVVFFKYNYNDQVKKDEMGGACSTSGGEEECM
jgi:hypothetical protein